MKNIKFLLIAALALIAVSVSGCGGGGGGGGGGSDTSATSTSANTKPSAPATPTAFKAAPDSPTQIYLEWQRSGDAECYVLYRDGVEINTVTDNSYTDENLKFSTSYSYRLVALSASGLRSGVATASARTFDPDPKQAVYTANDITYGVTIPLYGDEAMKQRIGTIEMVGRMVGTQLVIDFKSDTTVMGGSIYFFSETGTLHFSAPSVPISFYQEAAANPAVDSVRRNQWVVPQVYKSSAMCGAGFQEPGNDLGSVTISGVTTSTKIVAAAVTL